MTQARKFGAFAGVFTPSILTILGVIMYLRLPTIVGQAGLLQTLGIIAVAHVISVATGLSVSSIATDKRVKAGGTYFMISRSLGLPIGGTLGLALFVGLSFSVSLYLIGFAESFLSFWGWSVDTNMIRVTGTIALIGVTTVTLISTALALRTQFYIMAAIALSLISIVLGSHDFAPVEPLLRPAATAAPFIVLFGIFFPAVTGFEAGVSMSGDLRDPKRSIPLGTISAIGVGLLVYMALAAFLALTVDAGQLVNNPRVLLDIALFPPLVVAGIWGATISSAFGSILGAPRILQATSSDGITPRWFSVGYGPDNEPRNALVLAFIIAEAGILIGELDVIARIVSMFFITTYGFLNLAAAIESWVSPDFRPDFRVPKVVGLIGSAACFVVMIQLDFLAMVGASLLLGVLYFYLARKQLRLETGDAWEGVWSTVARAALHRLDRRLGHRRNWRPNVIMFSGGAQARPYLVELGRQLTGKRGMVTAFDLVEREHGLAGDSWPADADHGHTAESQLEMGLERAQAAVPGASLSGSRAPSEQHEGTPYGVFARRVLVDDVYEAMEETAAHYGFAGIEPNTVLMGWGRNARDPARFTHTIQTLAERDLNLLLLDYDRERGWGKRARIDVWWRLSGSDIALSLTLIRFLTNSDDWREAVVRFITVNNGDSALASGIFADMTRVLDESRVEAEVRVINNAVEQRSYVDLVRTESIDADLTILGLADLRHGDGTRFVENTNRIVDTLGTVLLAHASSFFAEPLVRAPSELPESRTGDAVEWAHSDLSLQDGDDEGATFDEIAFELVADLCEQLDQDLGAVVADAFDEYVGRAVLIGARLVEDAGGAASGALSAVANELAKASEAGPGSDGADHDVGAAALERARAELVGGLRARLERMRSESLPAQAALLAGIVDVLPSRTEELSHLLPERLMLELPIEVLAVDTGDNARTRLAKRMLRVGAGLSPTRFRMTTEARAIAASGLRMFAADALAETLPAFASDAAAAISDGERLLDAGLDSIGKVEKRVGQGGAAELAAVEAEALASLTSDLARAHTRSAARMRHAWLARAHHMVRSIASELSRFDRRAAVREARAMAEAKGLALRRSLAAPDTWERAQGLVVDGAVLHADLAALRQRLEHIGEGVRAQVRSTGRDVLVRQLTNLRELLMHMRTRPGVDGAAAELASAAGLRSMFHPEGVLESLRATLDVATREIPSSVETISTDSSDAVEQGRFEDVEPAAIAVARLVEFALETDLIGPLQDALPAAVKEAEAASEVAREVAQLVAFNLQSEGEALGGTEPGVASGAIDGADVTTVLESGMERIDREMERLTGAMARLDATIVTAFERSATRLEPYALRRAGDKLQRFERTQIGREVRTDVERIGRRIGENVMNRVVRLVYQRSESVLLTRRLRRGSISEPGSLRRIRELTEVVSPNPRVQERLPTYYRQLFVGRPALTSELRIGFDAELGEAAVAVEQFERGKGGAFLVLGEPGQGRTTLTGLVARAHFPPDRIVRVDPPDAGSISPATFARRLSAATGSASRDPGRLINGLPHGTAVILNDLSLWWERSPGGNAVIDVVVDLIARHGTRCFFIVGCSTRTFRLMNRIRLIEDQFARLVECEPFTARQLRDVILLRHGSTGMRFLLDNRWPEERVSDWRIARLFTRIFDVSRGNVGVALSAWVAAIRSVDDDVISIATPRSPSLEPLEALGSIHRMLLVQILLHERLDLARLTRISELDRTTLAREMKALERAGLIAMDANGIIRIGRYVRPVVTRFMVEQELI